MKALAEAPKGLELLGAAGAIKVFVELSPLP